jgi:shikimate dehydrogenase
VEGEAARIGAVNTIVVRDGKLVGTNTDVYGFLANLDANAPGWDANIGQVMVLGAGGASRAVIAGLLSRGAKVALVNRSVEKAQELAAIFGKAVTAHRFDEVSDLAPTSDMLVNTTAIGMGGSAFTDFPLSAFGPKTLVTDIVYTPLITPLLADARRQGLPIVDGLGMLLYQAVPGFTAWFGTRPDVSQTLRDTVIKAMGD